MSEGPAPTPPDKRSLKPRKLRMPRPKMLDWRTIDVRSMDAGGDPAAIKELLTYQENLDELLKHEGQYVLIKWDEILGIYPTQFDAMEAGADKFGEQRVLIKRIVASEPFHYFGYGLA